MVDVGSVGSQKAQPLLVFPLFGHLKGEGGDKRQDQSVALKKKRKEKKERHGWEL